MAFYSLRVLSDAGRITRRYEFMASSDGEASHAAAQVLQGQRGELRTAARTVCTWPGEGRRPEEPRRFDQWAVGAAPERGRRH